MNIGIAVRVALAKQDHDINWLADKLGVSHTRASKVARSTNVNSNTIARLAEIFGMKPSEFIALGEE